MFLRIQNEADKALVDWPKQCMEIAPYLDELLDLTVEFDAVIKDPVARKAGEAGLMLQQFRDKKGEGVTLCFFCDDAVGFYQDVTSRGIDASEPFVGNMMWVTEMTDPDGYELLFESPTNVVEGTKLSELAQTNLA